MILVQNDQKVGQIDATIKVNSVEETTKTDANGKMTLTKEYEVGTSISIEASKTGFAAKLDFMVEDNNGQDNLVTIELGYMLLDSCLTEGVLLSTSGEMNNFSLKVCTRMLNICISWKVRNCFSCHFQPL